jgi:hypothetical protein
MTRIKRRFISTFVRLQPDDYQQLVRIARRENRSYAAQIRHVLHEFVRAYQTRVEGGSHEQHNLTA